MPVLDDALLQGLTEAQAEAVRHLEGPLLVLAGPGSGKTRVITSRVAYLIGQGVPAWQILALTFTNKAAAEMRQRVDTLLDASGRPIPGRGGLTISTFHSLCARLLRRYAPMINLSDRYSIYDSADQRAAIKKALMQADLSTSNWPPASVAAQISNAKNKLMNAAAYKEAAGDFYTRSIAKAYAEYERILRANDALDFDDLLLYTAKLLRDSAEARDELQERYQYLLIDEYQDTNHSQFVLARLLAQPQNNICVVGDPDQSIYGWRGADITNILEFEEHFPDAKIVPLGENFRSTGHIVSVADALIRNNRMRKHKDLHTQLEQGEKPTVVLCRDEHHEAELVADELRKRSEEGLPWKDMAVIYRVNALSRVMEETLRNALIPYVIARGTAFYDRKEIKDALSYLRLIVNPNDEVSLMRIINTPTRGIGKTTLDKIDMYAARHQMRFVDALREIDQVPDLTARAMNAVRNFVMMLDAWRLAAESGNVESMLGTFGLAALVERVVRESGMEEAYRKTNTDEDRERLENLSELISAAAEFDFVADERLGDREPTLLDELGGYLESVALVSDADMVDPENGAVTLLTLHAAKGLEFDVVALIGLEEGLLPHMRAIDNDAELEEERRLCFVGITRARKHLLISQAARRTHRGISERTIRSRFIGELPVDAITISDQSDDMSVDHDDDLRSFLEGGKSSRSRDERSRRTSAGGAVAGYEEGCLVEHPRFGLGRIESITSKRPGAESVRVMFNSVGRKTLILQYAKLTRVH